MAPRAKSVRHLKDHVLEVTFCNGVKRVVPFQDEIISLDGEMIRPLQDVAYFAKVRVNPEVGVLEWPNGYDICPDILYWLATGEPIRFSTDPKYRRPPAHLRRTKRGAVRSLRHSRRRATLGAKR